MGNRRRTVYYSKTHGTLVLEEDGQRVIYNLYQPESISSLYTKCGFPEGHVGSNLRLSETPIGPGVLLYRTFLQRMPGQKQAEKLIWCCEISPDRDADPPTVLTVKEAKRKFNIDA